MASKKKVKKFQTAKAVLKWLDRVGAALDWHERKRLWDVLSALRGPDYDFGRAARGTEAKDATTAAVRGRALPNLAAYADADVHGNPDYYLGPRCREARREIPEGHFRRHAEDAFAALGMKW